MKSLAAYAMTKVPMPTFNSWGFTSSRSWAILHAVLGPVEGQERDRVQVARRPGRQETERCVCLITDIQLRCALLSVLGIFGLLVHKKC